MPRPKTARPNPTELARERQRRRRQRLAKSGFVPVSLPLPAALVATYDKLARRDKITRTDAMARTLEAGTQAPKPRPTRSRRLPKLKADLPPAAAAALDQLWAALTADSPRGPAVTKAFEALVAALAPSTPSSAAEPTPATEAKRLRELAAKLQADAGAPPSLDAMVKAGQGPQYQAARAAWTERYRAAQAFEAAAAALEQA